MIDVSPCPLPVVSISVIWVAQCSWRRISPSLSLYFSPSSSSLLSFQPSPQCSFCSEAMEMLMLSKQRELYQHGAGTLILTEAADCCIKTFYIFSSLMTFVFLNNEVSRVPSTPCGYHCTLQICLNTTSQALADSVNVCLDPMKYDTYLQNVPKMTP